MTSQTKKNNSSLSFIIGLLIGGAAALAAFILSGTDSKKTKVKLKKFFKTFFKKAHQELDDKVKQLKDKN